MVNVNGSGSAVFSEVSARPSLLLSPTAWPPPSIHRQAQQTTPTTCTMPRPKRQLHATVEDTLTPPDSLSATQAIARITKGAGNNLYNAELPNKKPILVELEPKFRSTIWIKRGSYVLVDMEALADRENKLDGEITNVVRDEKAWRKMGYWYVYKNAWVYTECLYSNIDTRQAERIRKEVVLRRQRRRGIHGWKDAAHGLGRGVAPAYSACSCSPTTLPFASTASTSLRVPHHTPNTVVARTPTTVAELAGVLGYTFHAHS